MIAGRALACLLLCSLAHVATAQVSCAAGQEDCDGSGSQSTCCACVAGKYKEFTSTGTCINCTAGKYSTTLAATSSSVCTSCGAGKYSATTGASTSSTCIDCAAGKISDTIGATTSSLCIDCAPKKTSPVGSSSFDDCVCSADHYLSGLPYMIGIQEEYPVANLTALGCTNYYGAWYSHKTIATNVIRSTWTVIGSKTSSSATKFSLVASIQGTNFLTSSSTTVAYPSNNAFWYSTSNSVGFAPSSNINLNPSDIESTDCEKRFVPCGRDLAGGRHQPE